MSYDTNSAMVRVCVKRHTFYKQGKYRCSSMWSCVNGYTSQVLRHIIKKQEQLLSALQGGLNL